jgi:hypothetical protein
MKRILLCLFILLSLSQARASDTLTVRQVFNFNVGDTFDYKISYVASGINAVPYNFHFRRFVVIDKWSSANTDTIFYSMVQLYPNYSIDTIYAANIDSTIVYFDTTFCSFCNNFRVDSLPDGRIDNTFRGITLGAGILIEHGMGIGIIELQIQGGDNEPFDAGFESDSLLIYYSKGTDTFGTPYYNQTTGINILSNIPQIHIYPNPHQRPNPPLDLRDE